jgi:hypothetical protein
MKKLILLLILSTTITFAQQRISKNLGDFNSVKVFSGLRVRLIKSDVNKIEIKGNNSEDVVVKNVNGLLKLSVTLPNAFDEDETLVRVFYTTDLDLLDVNEGAVITSEEKIKQDFIEIKAQEGARAELRLETNNIKIKAVTGGNIILSGKTTNQTVLVNTGGIYEGFDLQSKQANVVATTGGEAEINTTDLLNAKVKFQGFIIYNTEPNKIIRKKILGGTICSKDNYRNNGGSRVYN